MEIFLLLYLLVSFVVLVFLVNDPGNYHKKLTLKRFLLQGVVSLFWGVYFAGIIVLFVLAIIFSFLSYVIWPRKKAFIMAR